MPKFPDSLRQLFQIFDRESNFILQLLVIFMCSVAVVPALRQALQPVPLRVSQLPVLTQQMRLPEARPQRITPALTEAPKQLQQPSPQQLVPLPVVKKQPLPPRSSRQFSQSASRSVQRKNQTRSSKVVSLHSVKRSQQDPIGSVRSILKQDYKISRASGSYEQYMKWVRSTLKRYQPES